MNALNRIQFDLPASYASLEPLGTRLRAVLAHIEGVAEPGVTSYNIQLAATEIFANIAGHAYAGREDGWVSICLAFDAASRDFSIELHDTGAPFDPTEVPLPNLEELQEGGFGLFLAQNLMDDVMYNTQPDGNHWLLTKRI